MSEPIRIAQMLMEMNYGGIETVIMNYYRHIDRSKFQFDFIVLEGSQLPFKDEIESLGGRIYVVPHYKHLIAFEKAIIKIFKENKYQIVHSNMNALSVFSLYGAKKAGVPIRISHNHSTSEKGETKKNIVKNLLKPFSKIYPTELFACSRYAGEWLYGKNAKFTVINNAIELDRFKFNQEVRNHVRKELGIEDKFVVGHIGRFCYQKNHDLLIDIFKEVHERNPLSVLLLVGNGELQEEIQTKVNDLGLTDSVKFLGTYKDTSKLYQAMDVFCLPSLYEGLPVVSVEAQASGLSCVLANSVPVDARMLDSTVIVDKYADAKDYADKILNIPEVDRAKGIEEVREAGFDIDKEARKYMHILANLLEKI